MPNSLLTERRLAAFVLMRTLPCCAAYIMQFLLVFCCASAVMGLCIHKRTSIKEAFGIAQEVFQAGKVTTRGELPITIYNVHDAYAISYVCHGKLQACMLPIEGAGLQK